MRILFANKYYFRKGGAETVMFDEIDFMRRSNVDSLAFSMEDSRNLPSSQSPYFVSGKDYRSPSLITKIKSAATFIHSSEAARKITDLIRHQRPDILHCHNIYHQLTPSIITAAARLDIPVVLTLHDLKLVCPVYTRSRRGAPCMECSRNNFWPVVSNRCAEGSIAKSMLLWAEAHYHAFRGSYDHVARIIVPSRFMYDAVAPWFPSKKIVLIPNGVDTSVVPFPTDGDYVLFFGRVSPEKGVETLLRAHAQSNAAWRLVIAGTGPATADLSARYRDAEFVGHLTGGLLTDLIRKASVVAVPSECQENCPLAVLEAMAHGKPVVASRVGGIPELVRHGETGYLFRAGDRNDLSNCIETLMNDRGLRRSFGASARKIAEANYSLENHGRALIALYHSLGCETGQLRADVDTQQTLTLGRSA